MGQLNSFEVHHAAEVQVQLLYATVIVGGEACPQLAEEGKSEEEVIASLGTRGLPPERARPSVERAVLLSCLDSCQMASPRRGGVEVIVSLCVLLWVAYTWLG